MFPIRTNKVLEKLRKGVTPLGMQMYTPSPEIYELVGYAGFDYAMLDMEHSRVNDETMLNLLRAGENAGLTMYVRVAANEPKRLRYALESGFLGIVIPHIKTKEDVIAAKNAMRYPPVGHAGICPAIRGAGYSEDNWEAYMNFCNENVQLICLIEDAEGVENCEEIFSELTPGLDGFGLGLADLAHSLMKPGERVNWQHPFCKVARETVIPVGKKHKLFNQAMSYAADRETVEATKAAGADIILFHPDQHIFLSHLKGMIAACRPMDV